MSKDNINKLVEKYEQGNSTLLEEKQLSESMKSLSDESQAWFKFRKLNSKKVPENLQDSIWESIQRKRLTKRRFTISIIATAASILLLFSVTTLNPFSSKQSYKTKEALLNEALSMFDDSDTDSKFIPVYEDDMIIIYASAE